MLLNKSILSIKNLTKTYGKKSSAFAALKGVSLDINKGESIAIIGKSGSGKSTLMHILALLDKPTSGSVEIDGVDSNQLSNKELNRLRNRRFGFVFQQFFMNANDTVLNNVILPLKIGGVAIRERKKRAMEALKAVELDDKAKNKAIDLSGGQKQRVCIARALVNNPKVIFADEPTGNLDSATGAAIEDLLFNLNKEKGITLIVVTHDAELAERCQRQLHIKDGQIIAPNADILKKGARV
ncbi:MAG: ABC transporter ATP-binding protein [Candidatus Nomurabacteria bacterium]|jgi:putative ABC transport system ATP-binding protein|nr:ABC transporter ATP-binding protein [Candidatus Nomurabacteria bacterium]